MKPLPTWLQIGVWACHVPTKIVFQPKKCLTPIWEDWLLLDCNNQEYLLSECEEFDPTTHLSAETGLLMIGTGEGAVSIRCSDGVLRIRRGDRWIGIKLEVVGDRGDALVKAAQHLAHAFTGTVFEYPEYESTHHYQEAKNV